jgi:hypothetical protein
MQPRAPRAPPDDAAERIRNRCGSTHETAPPHSAIQGGLAPNEDSAPDSSILSRCRCVGQVQLLPDQLLPDQDDPDQDEPDQLLPDQLLPDQDDPDQDDPDQLLPDQDEPDQDEPDQELPDQELPDQLLPFQLPPDQLVAAASAVAIAVELNAWPKMSRSPDRTTPLAAMWSVPRAASSAPVPEAAAKVWA